MPNKKIDKKDKKKVAPLKKKVAPKPVKKAVVIKVAAKISTKKAGVKKPEKPVAKVKAAPVIPVAKKAVAPAPKVVTKKAVVAPLKVQPKPVPVVEAKSKVAPKEKPKKSIAPVEEPVEAKAVEEPVKSIEPAELEDEGAEEVVLTDAEGRRYCRVKDCDQLSTVDGYCRYHYLLYWKRIQIRKKILSEGKLERYVEELTARYPDKFLDMLRKDLRSEKEFLAAIQELEIDESAMDNDSEDETQTYIDEVRGMGGDVASSREEEDF